MFTEKQPKTGNEKKIALKKKKHPPFFVVTKGRLRLLSWLHLHQCLTDRPYIQGDWGPYLEDHPLPVSGFL